MLRDRLNQDLKTAMLAKNQRAISTIRLILAALKDRDICARARGETVEETEILQMLQSMIKQRRDSIVLYEQGCRMDLAQQEQEEMEIIQSFLPHQLDDAEIEEAVGAVLQEIGAQGLKDMGRVMSTLRERYAGKMDFGKASAIAKKSLS